MANKKLTLEMDAGKHTALAETIVERFAVLIGRNINAIHDTIEEADEKKGTVSVSLKLDLSGKNPKGSVKIGFAAKTTDAAAFDLGQLTMKLN